MWATGHQAASMGYTERRIYGIHQVQVTKHASRGTHPDLKESPKVPNKGNNDLTKKEGQMPFKKYMKKKEIFNDQDLQSGFASTSSTKIQIKNKCCVASNAKK